MSNLNDTVSFCVTKNTPSIKFLASLSDGRTVIQDDIPNIKSAWIRLQDFLKANPDLKITCLRLQGPNNQMVDMPSNQRGYFFGNKVQKAFPFGGQIDSIGVGYYDGNNVHVRWYNTSNFKNLFNEQRTKAKAGFLLISNES